MGRIRDRGHDGGNIKRAVLELYGETYKVEDDFVWWVEK